jgi:FAD/FMN-containing dehydrogenase
LQQPNWEANNYLNQTCFIDAPENATCSQGDVPVYGVGVLNSSDIAACVNFARDNNIRLVIKNTGHDYLGRSTAGGALSIWTHNMKNISFSDAFVPAGGKTSVGSTVTIWAGVQLTDLYSAMATQDKSVVAGMAHSVGAAGGYIQGGGHSPMANLYGQSTDNVIEYQVVVASVFVPMRVV